MNLGVTLASPLLVLHSTCSIRQSGVAVNNLLNIHRTSSSIILIVTSVQVLSATICIIDELNWGGIFDTHFLLEMEKMRGLTRLLVLLLVLVLVGLATIGTAEEIRMQTDIGRDRNTVPWGAEQSIKVSGWICEPSVQRRLSAFTEDHDITSML